MTTLLTDPDRAIAGSSKQRPPDQRQAKFVGGQLTGSKTQNACSKRSLTPKKGKDLINERSVESLVRIVGPSSILAASHANIPLPKTTAHSPKGRNQEPMLESLKSFNKLCSRISALKRQESSTDGMWTSIKTKSGLPSKQLSKQEQSPVNITHVCSQASLFGAPSTRLRASERKPPSSLGTSQQP